MMLPQMPNFNNSKTNLTPIYIQPSAPQPPALNAEDLKQVNIINAITLFNIKKNVFLDSRHVSKHGQRNSENCF